MAARSSAVVAPEAVEVVRQGRHAGVFGVFRVAAGASHGGGGRLAARLTTVLAPEPVDSVRQDRHAGVVDVLRVAAGASRR